MQEQSDVDFDVLAIYFSRWKATTEDIKQDRKQTMQIYHQRELAQEKVKLNVFGALSQYCHSCRRNQQFKVLQAIQYQERNSQIKVFKCLINYQLKMRQFVKNLSCVYYSMLTNMLFCALKQANLIKQKERIIKQQAVIRLIQSHTLLYFQKYHAKNIQNKNSSENKIKVQFQSDGMSIKALSNSKNLMSNELNRVNFQTAVDFHKSERQPQPNNFNNTQSYGFTSRRKFKPIKQIPVFKNSQREFKQEVTAAQPPQTFQPMQIQPEFSEEIDQIEGNIKENIIQNLKENRVPKSKQRILQILTLLKMTEHQILTEMIGQSKEIGYQVEIEQNELKKCTDVLKRISQASS